MKRYVIAAITCIALTVGVTPATASGGLGGVVQTLTGTGQQSTNTAGDASASNANGTSQSNGQSDTHNRNHHIPLHLVKYRAR